jgi:hypothetical protein
MLVLWLDAISDVIVTASMEPSLPLHSNWSTNGNYYPGTYESNDYNTPVVDSNPATGISDITLYVEGYNYGGAMFDAGTTIKIYGTQGEL